MKTLEQWTHDEEGVLMHCGEYGQWHDCPDHEDCYGVECAVCGASLPTDCMEGEEIPERKLLDTIKEVCPNASLEYDENGQVIIKTNMRISGICHVREMGK